MNAAKKVIDYNLSGDWYLLQLDYENENLRIDSFMNRQIELANSIYHRLELEDNLDVVLVKAKNFQELGIAYPNYFVDVKEFAERVMDVIG